MITDDKFKEYIGNLSDSYEKLKDMIYSSNLMVLDPETQAILGELSTFRDIACIALRESHTLKNFEDN